MHRRNRPSLSLGAATLPPSKPPHGAEERERSHAPDPGPDRQLPDLASDRPDRGAAGICAGRVADPAVVLLQPPLPLSDHLVLAAMRRRGRAARVLAHALLLLAPQPWPATLCQ